MRRLSHPRLGLVRVTHELLMPSLPEAYEDTLAAARGADLLVSMMATYATRLVAEKYAIPWVSALHIPFGFYSAYDPPVLDVAPVLSSNLRVLGPAFWRPLLWTSKIASRHFARPWYRQRAKIGLPPATDGSPFADSHSPLLVLALFSSLLADKQPDWPPQTAITGFPFYDEAALRELPPSLVRFLDEGQPPIVFTLGSAVCGDAGSFFAHSVAFAKLLNRRAVLVMGRADRASLPALGNDVIAVEYASFAKLFPRTAAIVHHGGVGTQASRCARPSNAGRSPCLGPAG